MRQNIRFVADMHELVNPNKYAIKLWKELDGKMPHTGQLQDLYYNSEDPLVKIFNEARRDFIISGTPTYIISVGDMIVNRINFGEGTEKSIAGKLGKKAREQGIPQHIYIAENYKEHLKEIEEWAYRNSFWTELRFEEIKSLAPPGYYPIFLHLNGNADALSSFVAREILNIDSPNEIFADLFKLSKYDEGEYFFAKDLPKVVRYYGNSISSAENWILQAHEATPDFEINDEITDYKWLREPNDKSQLFALMIPQTFEWGKQISKIEKILARKKQDDRNLLLIHEPLSYEPFSRNEQIEGMEAYKLALSKMPSDTIVIHGHTHAPFTKYQFEGHDVYQIPQNTAIKLEEMVK